jgi:hypothetical protein
MMGYRILLGYYGDMIEIQEVDLRANLGTWVGIPKLIGISCNVPTIQFLDMRHDATLKNSKFKIEIKPNKH